MTTDPLESSQRSAGQPYELLVTSIDGIVWEVDARTFRFTFVSPQAERLLGYPLADWLVSDFWLNHLHPDDRPWVPEFCLKATREQRSHDFEYRMIAADGRTVWLHDLVTVIVEGGEATKLRGVMVDITERKTAETALKQREAELDLALEAGRLGTWNWDMTTGHMTWSPFCKALYGLPATADITYETFLACVHPDDRERVDAARRRSLETGADYDVEKRVVWPDGSVHWSVSRGRLVADQDGKPVRMTGVTIDISDRKRAEQLEDQLRQAQKMEAVGRLAGGVAHDFNNLLTVINGCIELVFGRLATDEPSRELLAEVQKAGERAAALTRQLLAFSRKQVLQPKVLSVNSILTDLHRLLQRLIGEDIDLELTLDPALRLSKIDPGQFEQAIINLAINARDAMPTGGRLVIRTRNVELSQRFAERGQEVPPGPYVLVTVGDSGHGMDAATKAQIFEPFFTTKEAGQGTGLGLAMVYGFVRQSGGHVEVQSEPGKGATFNVFLRPAEGSVATTASLDAGNTSPKGTETVLIVEDEEAVRTVSRLVLQAKGYTVLEARDGHEAVWVAQQFVGPIHIVVTDIVMPRMSGHELAVEMARARPASRILFMAGYSPEVVARHNALEPEFEFLQKPFSPMGLARKVRDVLDGRGV